MSSHHFRDINNRNVHDFDLDLCNGPRSNLDIPIERPRAISYVLAIAMFAISIIVYEISAYEFPSNALDLYFDFANVGQEH